jgi:bifunctional non-homologous end joining protein LigD
VKFDGYRVEMGEYVWLEPRVVAEVKYTEWTDGGVLRHPQFVAIRDDKAPEGVRREA